MADTKPHVCFVAPTIWPVFSGDPNNDMVGGAEVQQAILARSLAAAGYRVSLICMDHGQPDGSVIDGVTVYRAHTPGGGLPVLRYLHPRLTSLWQAMQRADADIYYQRSAGMLTGVVAAFCSRHERRFIYAAASDRDFLPDLPGIRYGRDKWLFRRGVRQADAVVVQSERQMQACQSAYGRSATVVRSCHVPPAPAAPAENGYVLWAGSVKALKRPELFLQLARMLPQVRFRMVGGGQGTPVYEAMADEAATLPNVEFLGFIPYQQIQPQFDGARLFVNTSEWEGFPNTFLQAWARAVPAVSFFDTGSRQDGQAVVNVAVDLAQMAALVQQLMSDAAAWQAAGQRSLAHYEAQHTPRAAVAAYGAIFAQIGAAPWR